MRLVTKKRTYVRNYCDHRDCCSVKSCEARSFSELPDKIDTTFVAYDERRRCPKFRSGTVKEVLDGGKKGDEIREVGIWLV